MLFNRCAGFILCRDYPSSPWSIFPLLSLSLHLYFSGLLNHSSPFQNFKLPENPILQEARRITIVWQHKMPQGEDSFSTALQKTRKDERWSPSCWALPQAVQPSFLSSHCLFTSLPRGCCHVTWNGLVNHECEPRGGFLPGMIENGIKGCYTTGMKIPEDAIVIMRLSVKSWQKYLSHSFKLTSSVNFNLLNPRSISQPLSPHPGVPVFLRACKAEMFLETKK